jgi:predicted alpha/beta hydrolase family esterase
MRRRAYIIHGYQGYPEEAWLPWLKRELEKAGFDASLPRMPSPDHPVIAEWIGFISGLVGEPDTGTVLVGHSIGGQAVIRYLEILGAGGKAVGRTALVGTDFPSWPGPGAPERKIDDEVLIPWFTTGVDPAKVRKAAGLCTVILSDDDPYVPLEGARAGFAASLHPRIVIEHGKGHMNDESGITDLPSALLAATG